MVTEKIVIKGLVQGIGYRPFVAETAEQLHIAGWVRNTDGIVTVLASGEPEQLGEMARRLKEDAPAGAVVETIEREACPGQRFEGFSIMESTRSGNSRTDPQDGAAGREPGGPPEPGERQPEERTGELPLLPADLPTCDRCIREMHDEGNRRFRHPFISCTVCGPRYSIIEEIPYDREHISMKIFPFCPECGREYQSPGNIRRHAQTIACKSCGPKLCFTKICSGTDPHTDAAVFHDQEAISAAIRHLQQGGILAVKDIGGYHLAAIPFLEETVQELRRFKGREKKPFAVMFPNVETVRDYCSMDEQEERLLRSAPRPIVLLRKKSGENRLGRRVCGSSPDVGAMLPCNPVQILLTEALGPLIMTSANGSGELMITENQRMLEWMKQLCGNRVPLGILSHDRPILTPLDDSIVRVVCGKKQTLRRGRGMVPEPVPFPSERAVLAAGGDLKACFCYTGRGRAYLSQHLGDLMEESCYEAYRKELSRMRRLFGFEPELAVCDKHPGYRSVSCFRKQEPGNGSKTDGKGKQNPGETAELAEASRIRIQHHMAHVASVIAEHDLRGSVLGFAFDGTGYGEDGTVWGSEVFSWDGRRMERRAHLKPVWLIGGDEGAKNADTILYGYLASFPEQTADAILAELKKRPQFSTDRYGIVNKAVGLRLNCVQSSSMGRLFDAVSALLDICHYNSYEGEAAMELENLAATAEDAYPLSLLLREDTQTGQLLMDTESLFCGIAEGLRQNVPAAVIARGFLYAAADVIVEICQVLLREASVKDPEGTERISWENSSIQARRNPDGKQVALSGGTFLNRILLERVTTRLEAIGYAVYRNEEVPPGDGGICLGQAYLGALAIEQSDAGIRKR